MSDKTASNEKRRRWRVSRRGFLIGLGATGIGLALGIRYGVPSARLAIHQQFGDAVFGGGPNTPSVWFEINSDNTVKLFVPKSEMGQGIHTALAQIAADELEVSWEQLQVVQAKSGQGLDAATNTAGSTSVPAVYQPLREAAATLREMLRAEAAAQLGVAITDLTISGGVVSLKQAPTQSRTYGELVQNGANWEVPEEAPPLKSSDQFRLIGQSLPRVDLPAKITGEAIYGYDARLPEMKYGAIARPETLGGTLKRATAGEAETMPGVVKVVIRDDLVGVVAETRPQAYAALAALDVEWDEDETVQQAGIEAQTTVGQGSGTIIQKDGDPRGQLAEGPVVRAEYRSPIAVHAHLEAQAALVDVQADQVQAWISTQGSSAERDSIAEFLGREPETVTVTPTYLGGGFGRKLNMEAAIEAAALSEAVGCPVHIGWNRAEDMQRGTFRPPTHHVLRAKLDGNGQMIAMEHQQASGDVAFLSMPAAFPVIMGADFGAYRGAMIPYAIPHKGTTAWRIPLPLRTSWWRGLGLLANVFALESFMDEVAEAAQTDPLTFRLKHLGDDETGQRFKTVLETVAEKSGWGQPLPEGHAHGLAVSIDARTIVAQVAEVSVEAETDQIRVHKMTAVVDPGLAVNPDGIIAQTEGSIVMGLSSTLFEEITIKDGRVEATNFDRYPLLTMKETPDIAVTIIESGETPYGIGEPPIGPVAAAVANGVYQLTGQRLRRMPLKLNEV